MTKIILSDILFTQGYKEKGVSSSPLEGNFNFLHEVNGFANNVNLIVCKCRFYKLLDISVINETSGGFL